jgi:lipoprotein Spr/probable lipoprotein NlpC
MKNPVFRFLLVGAMCVWAAPGLWASVPDSSEAANADPMWAEAELHDYYARWGFHLSCEDNLPFYAYLRTWLYRTPYRYAGSTRQGTDCSGFVQTAFREFFGIELQRVAGPQLQQCRRVGRAEPLREGDLLFFSWNRSYIAHVGIYLRDGYFVHSALNGGVIISSLQEPYWKQFFYTAGRLGETAQLAQ